MSIALNSLERAVRFIKNATAHGAAVHLKADGSTPAFLNPTPEGFDEEWLVKYLQDEVRLPNFQQAMKEKGHGSIYLVSAHVGSVLHIRVLPGAIVFHYVD